MFILLSSIWFLLSSIWFLPSSILFLVSSIWFSAWRCPAKYSCHPVLLPISFRSAFSLVSVQSWRIENAAFRLITLVIPISCPFPLSLLSLCTLSFVPLSLILSLCTLFGCHFVRLSCQNLLKIVFLPRNLVYVKKKQ